MKPELILRPFKWNERRYPREYEVNLLVNLLFEEWNEWLDADKDVDLLDALLDTMFVAYGGIWKLNAEQATMQEALQSSFEAIDKLLQVAPGISPMYLVPSFTNDLRQQNWYPLNNLFMITLMCEYQCSLMGLTDDEINKAFEAVCDANDSKSIVKTKANVKANIDKGEFFIAPEPRLQAILDGRYAD